MALPMPHAQLCLTTARWWPLIATFVASGRALIVSFMYSDTLSNGFHVASGVPGASMYSGTHIHMHGKGDDPNFISRQRQSPPLPQLVSTFLRDCTLLSSGTCRDEDTYRLRLILGNASLRSHADSVSRLILRRMRYLLVMLARSA